jgi:hypothetical protein
MVFDLVGFSIPSISKRTLGFKLEQITLGEHQIG